MRFVGSQSIRRFMGLQQNNIDLMDIMQNGQILLVNLGASDFLDREAARVFAALLLNEFFETAMRRASLVHPGGRPKTFPLYLDEFQEYITDDIAAMLDQVRKGGLHMVLAHQHLGHFADNQRLKESVFTNARIRAVFGGLSTPSACELGEEMFLPDLNTRQIKKAYYHTIHLYREETRTIRSTSTSQTTGSGVGMTSGVSGPAEDWFSPSETQHRSVSESSSESSFSSEQHGYSETEVPIFVPVPVRELTNEVEWSREEKLSRVAEILKYQQQRHCFLKFDTEKTQPVRVPFVKTFSLPPNVVKEYAQKVYQRQRAISAHEADRLLQESEQSFLLNLGRRDPVVIDVRPEDQSAVGDEEFLE